MLGDFHWKICEGLRNLKNARCMHVAQSRRFVLAVVLSLCTLFPVSVLYALHEVDHRFTVEGRICGNGGDGIEAAVVSVKNTRADISGNGKSGSDGFYKVVLHLHNENQGDPLVIESGVFESTGRVELDPNDPKTERIVTVNLGHPCRALPFWRQTWVLAGAAALFGMGMILAFRQMGGMKGKGFHGSQKRKSLKK